MTFQTSINVLQGFGVPGAPHLVSPTRAESLAINSNGATPNVYGYFATKNAATNIAKMGGTIGAGVVFAGLMVNSKEAVLWGVQNVGTLAPSMAIPDNTQAEFATMGDWVVSVNTACNIDDLVAYNTTTGAPSTYAPGGSIPAGCAQVPNAVIYRYPVANSGGGLTIVRLTN